MRRLVFSLCALIFAAGTCIFTGGLIKKTAADYSETVIMFAQTTEKESDIRENGKTIEEIWEKKKGLVSLFVNEEVFAETDVHIRQLKYSSCVEEFRKRCSEVSEYVTKTAECELPKIENLF